MILAGLLAGVLAGLLGIGGGTVVVPILVTLGYIPQEAVATSSLAIIITSLSGSVQNWRMGYLNFRQVALLGAPAAILAPIGAKVATGLPPRWLLLGFAGLLVLNLYLVGVRRRLTLKALTTEIAGDDTAPQMNPLAARILTGSSAGFLGGLFGVGGGVIMVPLQMVLLAVPIKQAIQTSLGVVVITAIVSTAAHAQAGNVVWMAGIILGLAGLASAQLSTRILPKLPDALVTQLFRALLITLSVYMVLRAWWL